MSISRMLSATMIAGAPDAGISPAAAANPAPALAPMRASRLGMIARRRPHASGRRGPAQAPAASLSPRSAAVHNH